MTDRIFVHTLSAPEHVWLNFWREFFRQQFLIFEGSKPLPNRFYLDPAVPAHNRPFDVVMAFDFDDSRQNALPALVIEDTGANQLGLTMGQLKTHSHSPQTARSRADMIRFTYVFHCLSRNRGESQMLAAIVSKAVTVFREHILSQPPMQKIEPWSIGATQPLKSDGGGETYLDTPVQITFETIEFWDTLEIGEGTAEGFGVSFASDEVARFVRAFMTVTSPASDFFIRASTTLVNPTLSMFVNAAMTMDEAASLEHFIRGSMAIEDVSASDRFVRASMRVS